MPILTVDRIARSKPAGLAAKTGLVAVFLHRFDKAFLLPSRYNEFVESRPFPSIGADDDSTVSLRFGTLPSHETVEDDF